MALLLLQDVELAGVDAKQAITVRVKHDDKIPESQDAHFQVGWACGHVCSVSSIWLAISPCWALDYSLAMPANLASLFLPPRWLCSTPTGLGSAGSACTPSA